MPAAARTEQDIARVRARILDAATDLLAEEGFASWSMRKLGTRVGMTAANLYNYYSGKDEIYLAVQTRGFDQLRLIFEAIENNGGQPREKIRDMMRAYLEFGVQNPDLYGIMFTMDTPKHADYLGTPLEAAATLEKQTALLVAESTGRVLADLLPGTGGPDPVYLTIQAWTAIHGIVSLINSRVLAEVDPDIENLSNKLVTDIFSFMELFALPKGAGNGGGS